MNPWRLGFVLPLLLFWGFDTEATVVKTSGREPVVTPVCGDDKLDNITLITCSVTTKRNECRLLHRHGQGFTSSCGSRFTLRDDSRSVSLHLIRLTPDDSGSYACRCSRGHGTDKQLHLDITVEGDGQSSSSLKMLSTTTVIAGAAACITVTGFVLGLALRRKYCRARAETGSAECGASCSLDQAQPDDLYVNLPSSSADCYVRIQQRYSRNPVNHGKGFTAAGRDTGHSWEIYENI